MSIVNLKYIRENQYNQCDLCSIVNFTFHASRFKLHNDYLITAQQMTINHNK